MNQDFRDLLAAFNARSVDYIVVGAHALAAHGHVRATKDLDVWVRPTAENAPKVIDAIRDFGAPLHDLTISDLAEPGIVFQIGASMVRIDILTSIDGVEFEPAWKARMLCQFSDQPVSVLSRDHLIQNKKSAGRPQDIADVAWLESQAS